MSRISKLLNEGTRDDFISNYGKELKKLLKAATNILNDANKLSDDNYETFIKKMEKTLSPYDKQVVSYIIDDSPRGLQYDDFVRLAMDIQNRFGTEPRQVVNALDDFVYDAPRELKKLK